jgi:hypothetical protein
MKKKTIILTFAQAYHLLTNLPKGHQIKAKGKDLDRIINVHDKGK